MTVHPCKAVSLVPRCSSTFFSQHYQLLKLDNSLNSSTTLLLWVTTNAKQLVKSIIHYVIVDSAVLLNKGSLKEIPHAKSKLLIVQYKNGSLIEDLLKERVYLQRYQIQKWKR